MKIMSYNIRGLGRGLKWASIRKLVKRECVEMLCLQETKKDVMDKALCQALWGDSDVKWELQPECNGAGGILCMWSEQIFKLEKKIIGCGFIYLEGIWVAEGAKVTIVNIYSPCDLALKRSLWEQIRQIRNANLGGLWCVVGDFNTSRRPSERLGVCQRVQDEKTMKEFNEWIADLEVEDVPCVGRKFTWYRPNGTTKSRLDKFLVSVEWTVKWQGSTQFILDRNFSDHCPILLTSTRNKNKKALAGGTVGSSTLK
ncbi:hypothetical protein AAZX31_14G101500 [Glycine max]